MALYQHDAISVNVGERLREAERLELQFRHSIELQRSEARVTEIVRSVQEAIVRLHGYSFAALVTRT